MHVQKLHKPQRKDTRTYVYYYLFLFIIKTMTKEEKLMLQPSSDYIRALLEKRNAGTEGCMISSELAREFGINARDLHHFLIDVGFLYRERSTHELMLCKDFAGKGYAMTRSFFRYNRKGDLVEKRFPVWTEKGQRFIKKMIMK